MSVIVGRKLPASCHRGRARSTRASRLVEEARDHLAVAVEPLAYPEVEKLQGNDVSRVLSARCGALSATLEDVRATP